MSDPLVTVMLPGPPVPKGRPRFRIVRPRGRPQFVSVYSPPETAAYERALAAEGKIAMRGRKPLGEALSVTVEAFIGVPDSWSAKKRAAAIAGDIQPTSRPDIDNFVKTLDALNKIVWTDDSLIVAMQSFKRYSEWPRLRISIWLFDDIPAAEPELL